jgi:hypothetical protein
MEIRVIRAHHVQRRLLEDSAMTTRMRAPSLPKALLPYDTGTGYLSCQRTELSDFHHARGIAVLCMIAVHVMQIFGTVAARASVAGAVVEFIGGPPAAPVFMSVMGALFMMARRTTGRRIRRGLLLIALGYLLNLIRGTIPVAVGLGLGVFSPEEIGSYSPLGLLPAVDILVFAGISYLVMAIIASTIKRPVVWLVVAVAIAVGSRWLWGSSTGSAVVDAMLEPFIGVGTHTSFPAFPWLVHPIAVIHWIVIGWSTLVLGFMSHEWPALLLLFAAVLVCAVLLSVAYHRCIAARRRLIRAGDQSRPD